MPVIPGLPLATLAIFVDQQGNEFAAVISRVHNEDGDDVDLHVFVESGIEVKERVPYSDDHTQLYTWHFPLQQYF
jgi:hypothetical protein